MKNLKLIICIFTIFIIVMSFSVYSEGLELKVIVDDYAIAGGKIKGLIFFKAKTKKNILQSIYKYNKKFIIKTTGTGELYPKVIEGKDIVNGAIRVDFVYNKAEKIRIMVIDVSTGTIGTSNKVTIVPAEISRGIIKLPETVRVNETTEIRLVFFDKYNNLIKIKDIDNFFSRNEKFELKYNEFWEEYKISDFKVDDGKLLLSHSFKKTGNMDIQVKTDIMNIDFEKKNINIVPGSEKEIKIICNNITEVGEVFEIAVKMLDSYSNEIKDKYVNITILDKDDNIISNHEYLQSIFSYIFKKSGEYKIIAETNNIKIEKDINVKSGKMNSLDLQLQRDKGTYLKLNFVPKDIFGNITDAAGLFAITLKDKDSKKVKFRLSARQNGLTCESILLNTEKYINKNLNCIIKPETLLNKNIILNDIFYTINKIDNKRQKIVFNLEFNDRNLDYGLECINNWSRSSILKLNITNLVQSNNSFLLNNRIINKISFLDKNIKIYLKNNYRIEKFSVNKECNILKITAQIIDIKNNIKYKNEPLSKYFENTHYVSNDIIIDKVLKYDEIRDLSVLKNGLDAETKGFFNINTEKFNRLRKLFANNIRRN